MYLLQLHSNGRRLGYEISVLLRRRSDDGFAQQLAIVRELLQGVEPLVDHEHRNVDVLLERVLEKFESGLTR